MKRMLIGILALFLSVPADAQTAKVFVLDEASGGLGYLSSIDPSTGKVTTLSSAYICGSNTAHAAALGGVVIDSGKGIYYSQCLTGEVIGGTDINTGNAISTIPIVKPSGLPPNPYYFTFSGFNRTDSKLYGIGSITSPIIRSVASLDLQTGQASEIAGLYNNYGSSSIFILDDKKGVYFLTREDGGIEKIVGYDIHTGSQVSAVPLTGLKKDERVNLAILNPWNGTVYGLAAKQFEDSMWLVKVDLSAGKVSYISNKRFFAEISGQYGPAAINPLSNTMHLLAKDGPGQKIMNVSLSTGLIVSGAPVTGAKGAVSNAAVYATQPPAAIADIELSKMQFSPNPASDHLNISIVDKAGADIQVYDITGRVVLQKKMQAGNKALIITSLAPGSYILRASLPGGNRQWGSFIKE